MQSRWQSVRPCRSRIVIWGAADQGRVNAPILRALGCKIVAMVDDTPNLPSPFPGVPIFHGWEEFEPWLLLQDCAQIGFVLAIGNPYGHVRRTLHSRLLAAGLAPVSFADESALLCASALFGPGLQVMPMVIVNNDARVGTECILNTRSLIEHDCVLEDGVEVGPGAILCGRVCVGENTWIGAGVTVRPRVRIGRNAIIGAGAVVVSDIPDNVVAIGVPAKPVPGRITPSAQAAG